jgi:hypothetical protein
MWAESPVSVPDRNRHTVCGTSFVSSGKRSAFHCLESEANQTQSFCTERQNVSNLTCTLPTGLHATALRQETNVLQQMFYSAELEITGRLWIARRLERRRKWC